MNNQYKVLVFKLILACTVAMLFDMTTVPRTCSREDIKL